MCGIVSYIGNKHSRNIIRIRYYVFFVTKSQSVNAFAAPGGYIGLNAGLITLTENEAQLAGVVAHELSELGTVLRILMDAELEVLAELLIELGEILCVLSDLCGSPYHFIKIHKHLRITKNLTSSPSLFNISNLRFWL